MLRKLKLQIHVPGEPLAARRLRNTVLGHMVHFITGRIALTFEESKDFLRRARGKMVKMEGDTWELSEHM